MGIPNRELSGSDIVSQRLNHLMFINDRMTQRSLGFRLGVKPTTLGSKFSGVSRWNVDEIIELATIFDVSTDYLLGRESLDVAQPVNTERPASDETGRSDLVAGAGFEPTTSGL